VARKVIWKAEPDEHDYPAAAAYLSLIAEQDVVDRVVAALQSETVARQKAKDILRASGLPLLPQDNPHVVSDLSKIKKEEPLSPVLLVRGDLSSGHRAQIADGYHRVCASYYTDENTDIPCRIVAVHPQ
jgi:predicted GTPase